LDHEIVGRPVLPQVPRGDPGVDPCVGEGVGSNEVEALPLGVAVAVAGVERDGLEVAVLVRVLDKPRRDAGVEEDPLEPPVAIVVERTAS
jgi:hypothetical protein